MVLIQQITDALTVSEYTTRMKIFLKCMWVCLRVGHLGQKTFQAFLKSIYLQNSLDAFQKLIPNLACFKVKEFLIFFRHLPLFLYRYFPFFFFFPTFSCSSVRENIQLQKQEAYPYSQIYKQSSRLGKREIEIHFQWSSQYWATLFNSSSPPLLWKIFVVILSIHMEFRVESFLLSCYQAKFPQSYNGNHDLILNLNTGLYYYPHQPSSYWF